MIGRPIEADEEYFQELPDKRCCEKFPFFTFQMISLRAVTGLVYQSCGNRKMGTISLEVRNLIKLRIKLLTSILRNLVPRSAV